MVIRYRIKIITYKNGRKIFIPQLKTNVCWMNLGYRGGVDIFSYDVRTRNDALEIIDKHYTGNAKRQIIEFEYINKP